jgi:hypothetical protein
MTGRESCSPKAWENGKRPRRASLYLLTFTVRYDPTDPSEVSVDGLRRRKALVQEAFRHAWRRYLKPRMHAAVSSLEVSPRGAVHLHVLYHGLRPDIVAVRELWLMRLPDSPQINVRYVQNPAGAIREVAKYVTKGASPSNPRTLRGQPGEFTDPVLAARVEVAFSGRRHVECYGAWRGADSDEDEQEEFEGAACVKCGLVGEWDFVHLQTSELVMALGAAFRPRLVRAGAGPPGLRRGGSHRHSKQLPRGRSATP